MNCPNLSVGREYFMINTIINAVESVHETILSAERHIWKNPETGFREWKTSKYLSDILESWGYSLNFAGNIPGFYTDIETGRPGPKVMVLCELDSLICSSHPESDPATGAVHCCGHHAQCAAFLGVAAALRDFNFTKSLSGSIRLCAVPAEETIEIEYRQKLKAEGKIKYLSGKLEFINRGYFDGVDMAFMVHTTFGKNKFEVRRGDVGLVAKAVTYKGVSAHAGGSPHEGINALYAANIGMNAINALRETFKESDLIRVHPIISKGGEAVNAIPDDVRLQSFVRALSFDAMKNTNKKVNRALAGAALSMGSEITISDTLGASPLINDETMSNLFKEAVSLLSPSGTFEFLDYFGTSSTDMGDLSMIMPVIHPYAGGAIGKLHGSDFYIEDPQTACVDSAKVQLILLYLLLSDGAKGANEVSKNKGSHIISKEELLKTADDLTFTVNSVTYIDEDTASVSY